MKLLPLIGALLLATPALADDQESEEAPAASPAAEPTEAPGASEISAGAASAAGGAAQGGAGMGRGDAKPERRPGASSAASGGSGGGGSASGGSGAGGGKSAFKGRFQIFEKLSKMKLAGAHGIMSFNKDTGYSVGFKPNANGACIAIASPAAPAKDACMVDVWLSEKPGGAPLPGCSGAGGLMMGGGGVAYFSSKPATRQNACVLKSAAKRLYCNIAVSPSVWEEHPGLLCGGLLNSPLGADDHAP